MANDPVLMPEEVLILLGAIEQFNSGAFRAEPAQFFEKLHEDEADNPSRLTSLKRTMKAYRDADNLVWPTEEHIRLYRNCSSIASIEALILRRSAH
jgi:hypothetical protein